MAKHAPSLLLSVKTVAAGHIVYDAAWLNAPDDDWFDPVNHNATVITDGGRGSAWFICLPAGQAVLRHYRRGGLVARLTQNRYVWMGAARTRSFREFDVLAHLYAQGCRVPRPLAAAWWRHGLTYIAAIVVERLPDVQSLAHYVLRPRGPGLQGVALAVAQAIEGMHAADVWHADLNAHNILINPAGEAWLIDFDRARIGVVTKRRRRDNILRLRRSLIKQAGSQGADFHDLITARLTSST